MRRDAFLKSLAALAAASALPLSVRAAGNLKMLIPANPGGGWDQQGRALGKSLMESGAASTVSYDNRAAPRARSASRSSSTAPRATATR